MVKRISLTAAFTLILLLMVPFFAHAAMSDAANAMCDPWIPKCGCNKIPSANGCVGGKNTFQCPPGVCIDKPPGGTVLGICEAKNKCKGVTSTNQQGQSQGMGSAQGFQEIMKGMMDILKQVMQPQPPPPPSAGGGGGAGQQQGCTQYYQVTAPSSDPCAYYVPPVSDSLLDTGGTGSSDALQQALQGLPNVSDQLMGAINPLQGGGESQTTPTSGSTTVGAGLQGQAVNLGGGAQGNIILTPTGATVVAGSRDTKANTEVAGFYGSPVTLGNQPQSVVARLCQSRPWAGSVVTYVIPPSFFDSLCSWRGYQVGVTPAPSAPTVVQQKPKTPAATTTVATPPAVPTIAPQVDIWAVPPKVPLGARTTIFWNTKGVESCTVSSPDGSFEEHALSGGAATVALTGATTFTLSCVTSDNKPVTDYVTVNLAI